MKAALLAEYHRPLELVERPVPEPSRHSDVLVRVGAAGVCATDLHAIDGLMEPAGVTLPLVLGHENAGWVEAVGDGVTTVSPGDAVLVYPPYSCGLCVACRRGNDMHCARHDFTGLTVDGGFNLDSGSNGSMINNVGIDFIEQVAIQTSNFSADKGRNSGAAVAQARSAIASPMAIPSACASAKASATVFARRIRSQSDADAPTPRATSASPSRSAAPRFE